MTLSPAQRTAIDSVNAYARTRKAHALAIIEHVLRMSDTARPSFARALDRIKAHARVALHFHPDRLAPRANAATSEIGHAVVGPTVIECMLEDGRYRSQFETRLSSGEISFEHDVDVLVADPCFRGTAIGYVMAELCQRYDIAQYWHCGFMLNPSEVPRNFRGPTMPSLAQRVARDGIVDAKAIGDAAASVIGDPDAWADRGTASHVGQELKWLWHCLLKLGRPSTARLGNSTDNRISPTS